MKIQFFAFLYRVLPKGLISRIMGGIARLRLPRFLLDSIINAYCANYRVNRDEMEVPPGGFVSFNMFFTRKLKKGVHTIDRGEYSVVSPVDGRVDQCGAIDGSAIIQAKGISYTVESLVPSGRAKDFMGGSFITIYLSPADYHRIHSPVTGKIDGYLHIPGKLFTVQKYMVDRMPGLFAKNERIITFITTGSGKTALCKIGALGVGRITLSYAAAMTNRFFRSHEEKYFDTTARIAVKKGDEVGLFNLGSTVILLFENGMVKFNPLPEGTRVRMGQKIGVMKKRGR